MPEFNKILESALFPAAVLVGSVVFLIWVALKIRSWFRESDGPAELPHEMLTQYREMRERGDLSEKEFRLIKSRLANAVNPGGPRTQEGP